jgi:hypothetical protein
MNNEKRLPTLPVVYLQASHFDADLALLIHGVWWAYNRKRKIKKPITFRLSNGDWAYCNNYVIHAKYEEIKNEQ